MSIRVLIVDDQELVRTGFRLFLETQPELEVVGEAADGGEGGGQALDLQPDVVLLDLSMPECDGLEAIPIMRERAPRSQIVALSGFTADRMSEPVIGAGARAYLEKGVDLSEITATIRTVYRDAA